MKNDFVPKYNAGKIAIFFIIISAAFFLFFVVVSHIILADDNHYSNYKIYKKVTSKRGTIFSRDGKVLASSKTTYYVAFDGRNLTPDKKELFVTLFCLYTSANKDKIRELLNKNKRVKLLDKIDLKTAIKIKKLNRKLDNLRVFQTRMFNNRPDRRGLELGEELLKREYPYGDFLEPVLGNYHKFKNIGQTGIENSYEDILSAKDNGFIRAYKDKVGNIIYNQKSYVKDNIDGNDIILTINSKVQKDLETLILNYKKELRAKGIIVGIMDSTNAKIIALASSNRYTPYKIKQSEVPFMSVGATQYLFEPGSIVKPFVLATLLEDGLVGQYDLIQGHNGRFKLQKKIITDTHPVSWISAEDAIVHSSNIAMAQLAQRINAYRYKEMLTNLGFLQRSGIELNYETIGLFPNVVELQSPIIKATCSYGYGFSLNFIQILKAYNLFNNSGFIKDPSLVYAIIDKNGKVVKSEESEKTDIYSQATAKKMLKILRKTVLKGTARRAIIDGIFTAGKTGTAHIAKKGGYDKTYHSTFFGFANDKKSKYTIGVLVIDPRKEYFASKTAVPIFKQSVEILIKRGWLKKNNTKLK